MNNVMAKLFSQADHNLHCNEWLELLDELNIGAFLVGSDRGIGAMNYSAQALMGLKENEGESENDEENIFFKDHAWFVAYAPSEKPRIAVAVLVLGRVVGPGARSGGLGSLLVPVRVARLVAGLFSLQRYSPSG